MNRTFPYEGNEGAIPAPMKGRGGHLARAMNAFERRVWDWHESPSPDDDPAEFLSWLLARWRVDPICMAVEAFRSVLMPYQVQMALDLNDAPMELYEFYGMDATFPKGRVLAPSGHGLGKTRFMAFSIWHHLLTRQFSKVITTAPTSEQLTGQLWGEIRKLRRRLQECSIFPGLAEEWEVLGSSIVHKNPDFGDWGAVARTARPERPEALQGSHALDADDEFGDLATLFSEERISVPTGGIFICAEEASGIDDSIREVLEGALSEAGAKFFAPGNPTRPDGWFARDLDKANQYAVHHLDCRQSDRDTVYTMKYRDFSGKIHFPRIRGFVSSEYVSIILKDCDGDEDADRFRVRVRGHKPRSAFDSCIKAGWVDAAMSRVARAEDAIEPAVIGLDFGLVNDSHGMGVRRGFAIIFADEWLVKDDPTDVLMEAARRAIDAVEIYGARYIVGDSNGVGAGIMSYLSDYFRHPKQLHLKVKVIHFNSGLGAIDSARYYRRRDEMWFKKGRSFISDPRCSLPNDPVLRSQLLVTGYHEDSSKKIAVEPKEKIKKRAKEKSGNRADAVLHTLMVNVSAELPDIEQKANHPPAFERHFRRLNLSARRGHLIG